MGLLSTLGVSKMDKAVKKSFPLNSKTCVVYSIEVYVILTNQKLLLENDFPSFIFSFSKLKETSFSYKISKTIL